MKQTTYERWYRPFRTERRRAALIVCDRLVTYSVILLYGSILLYLLVSKDPKLFESFLIPAVFFVAVSAFRAFVNAPRPYEAFGTKPALPREKTGKSMPSRHVASASMIGMVTLYCFGWWGLIPLGMAIFIACIRVIGGVHFVKDVLVGFACGVLAGLTLFLW
ncbi:MAG: phosphatase PAP2 family protein [Clostridia bacterium]|nr:phosphatase PAP2 family protein [Clostridia bacterium]